MSGSVSLDTCRSTEILAQQVILALNVRSVTCSTGFLYGSWQPRTQAPGEEPGYEAKIMVQCTTRFWVVHGANMIWSNLAPPSGSEKRSELKLLKVLDSGVSFKALGSGGESSHTCRWVSPAGRTPCQTQYPRQWSDRGQTPPDCHCCPPLYPRCQISLRSDAQPGNRREENKWKQIFGTLYAAHVHVLALFSSLLL